MEIFAVLAAEESSASGVPLWLTAVFAILLLWVLAIGLSIWVVFRLRKTRRRRERPRV